MARRKVFVPQRLIDAREMRGLSQEDLAALMGSGTSQISRYENGETEPTLDIVERLARILQVSMDWMVGLSGGPAEQFNVEKLTPKQWAVIYAFQEADTEKVMRLALERKKEKPDNNPRQAKSK